MIHTLEKMITEQGEKLTASDREPLDLAIKKVRDSIATGDVTAIKAATSELEQAAQAFRSTLGAQPASGGDAAASGSKTPGDDDAIDAEFEVKN